MLRNFLRPELTLVFVLVRQMDNAILHCQRLALFLLAVLACLPIIVIAAA